MKALDKLEEWIGGTLFLAMFAILVAQIFSRQLFDSPLIWSEELARLLFVYVGMLGISIGVRNQQHVLIDFLINRFSSKGKLWVFTFVQCIIFASIILMIYYGLKLMERQSYEMVSLGISDQYMYMALPILSFLMLFRFLQAQFENQKHQMIAFPAMVFVILAVILLLILFIKPEWYKALQLKQYVNFGKDTIYVVLAVWLVLMFMGTPVGWSLFIATVLFFALTRWKVGDFAASKLVDSLNSFSLLSVPFFILTGILMNSSGITERIFNFAKTSLGHLVGGMGHVNIFASLVFSGMSGSALADAGGLGQLEIKAMRDSGYDDDICGGVTAASCIIGPLVPPSIAMIIYGVIANESIAKLFLAGFVPGIILTLALMVMNHYICKKRGYRVEPRASKAERRAAFKSAFWAILTPFLIIGGIFSGLFTPTEAAVIAALYSIFLGMFVYKELTLAGLFRSCVETIAITGVTVLMVMTVTFFGDMIAREQVAMRIAEGFMSIADSALMVLVMINLLLLFLGMFIDALALQFLVLPMLIPIAQHYNIDLVFFGVMTTLNMMIGILTPPMGMALFVVARVGNMSVSTVTKGVIPFIIPIFLTLVLITLFPSIVTFVPNLIMG
ncbi:MAG: TRAP transporter large permease subunit [Cardiobacteriaceae bacterium]|nr:TRAP transporter large permease subunit [Cardiobacteriaceae bacterium]